tara:strand:+ start:6235 stop:6477 length:243 start_codon:yes stop_codon:yes gene_type:complete
MRYTKPSSNPVLNKSMSYVDIMKKKGYTFKVCRCGHIEDVHFAERGRCYGSPKKCVCKKFVEELQGLTHKGIKKTDLLLD